MEDRIQLSRKEYTIGWLCSLPESELIAARSMLDVRHKKCELPSDDENLYTYGSISGHNIVIACMPPGIPRTSSTTKLVQPLSRNFPNMRIYLFIGIGSGIPRDPIPEDSQDDIHLGDVVVGWNKRPGIPSIVQCNFQRLEIGEDEHIGSLDKPDRRLLNALTTLQKNHSNGRTEFAEHVKRSRYSHPGLEKDHLYESTYNHIVGGSACSMCDLYRLVDRPKRNNKDLVFHLGTILSGNSGIKKSNTRDQLSRRFHDALCIETEAFGAMGDKLYLIVRGISDYADSHKNRTWQPYAATAAAALARELLYTIEPLSTGINDLWKPEEYHVPLGLPTSRDLNFKGREDIFAKIRRSFWSSNSSTEPLVHSLGRRVVSLCGLDGSGKTHTALEYAYRYSNEYSAIFWLNATSKIELEKSARQAIWSIININTRNADTDTLEDSNQTYFRIAHSLGLDGRGIASDETLMGAAIESSPIKCLNHWLCRGSNSKWLLILDNYDDPAACAEVLDSLLPVDIGHVLITSRLQNSYGSCTDIEMFAGMEQQEAVELLHQISGKRATTEEHQTVLAIVDSVGKLPLAIELIGAYIRKYSVPFDSYAESLGENLKERLGKIHAVCEISFRKLTREAKNMIQLLSLMGNEDIPYKFLEAGREVVNWMGSTRNALNKTIGELLSLRLISERHDNGYYIHPLVHRWVRDYTDNATFKNSLLVVNIVTSTFVFGDGRTQSQSAYQYRILPHIECCSEIFFKYLAPQSGAAVNDKSKRIAYNLARMYTNLGNIPKSSAIYERSLQNATGHPSCLELKMMDALGVSLRLQGEYDKALRWCTRALDGTKSQGGNDSSESLIITTHVAAILRARGDYSESIARYRWVLERQEEKIGYLHPQTLETRHQLAGALISSAEYAEALDLLEQVQEEKEKRLGKYHPSVLEIIDNIATILEAQGSYDEALRCYKLAYETRAHILGENHYSTLGSKSGIGRIYERLGQYEECLAQYGGVLEQLESMFGVGEDHPWVLRTFSNIADVLVCLERYNEAEKLYRKAYVGLKRLPMRVDGKIQIAEKIAGLLRDQGQYKEALQWSKEVELGYQKEQDEGSELLLAAKSCTASIHALEGNYETALDIYGQVLKSYEKKQGKTCYAEALWTELSMGKILIYQAKHQEAFELLARAEKGFSNLVGPDHYHTLEAVEFRNQAIRKLDEEFRQRQKEEEIRREEERKLREEERIVREQEAEQKLREQEAKRKLQEKEAERKKQEKEAERKLREQLEQVLRNQEEERRLQRQQEQKLLELEAARKLREEEAAQKLREQEAAQKLREQEAAKKLREQEAAQKLREQEEQKLRQQEEQKLRQQEREQRLREQEVERKLQEQEEERKLQEREAKRKLREQEEKRKLQEEERKLREEEEKKKLREEEEKKKLREEEEKKKLREEEEKKKLREEEEKREQQEKEFKEKLQKEELEREFQEQEEKRLQEKELVLRQQEAERKLREQEEERRLQRQQEEKQLHQDEEKKHRRQEEEEKEEEERKRWQEEKEKEVRKGKKKWKWGRLNCFKEY
ncbi:hypothetical protein TWF594_008147 [Orbilia oligospora]|nr:hypothetical protein TWF706_000731 [Orbilia oligospora]KAF3150926.1 hypothetical protein TWF594_008147 [Orbilia oligospora]